jgi:transposase
MGASISLRDDFDGGRRTSAARIGGVGLQIVRAWVLRFNARGPDGLLDDAQRRALVEMVECGPIPSIHGVVRWRLIDPARWLYDEFAVSLDATTMGRELKRLGYVKLTVRPRHYAQNELAMEAFKKGALPTSWQRSEELSRRARR